MGLKEFFYKFLLQIFPFRFKEIGKFIRSETGWIILFCCFAPTLIFNAFFIECLNEFLVDPLFSEVKASLFLEVSFWVTALIILIDIILKFRRRFIESEIWFAVAFVVGFNYFLFRFIFTDCWNFESVILFDDLKYLDILLLLTFSSTFFWFRNFLIVGEEQQVKNSFLSDAPIKDGGEDELNRNDFAKAIVSKINDIQHLDNALAIGITGSWGSGKSSFLRLIENELADSKDVSIVKFNPWQLNSSTSLIEEFFATLGAKLKKYNANLTGQINAYTQKLTAISPNLLTSIFSTATSFLDKEKSLNDVFEDINRAIERLGKKLIIFIDDIDRLEKEEVLEVIRLIRNTANFNNTIFIAAFDRDYIVTALKELKFYQFELYLEKIFQLEIALPAFEEGLTKKYLKRVLIENFEKEEALIQYYFDDPDSSTLTGLLKSRRDIIRYINSLMLVYTQLKNEAFFIDLMNLEIVRLKFPRVYNILGEKPSEWLEENSSGLYFAKFIQIENDENHICVGFRDELNLIHHLQENRLDFLISIENIKFIKDWLNATFNSSDDFVIPELQKTQHLSINRPNHFRKYFAYRLLNDNFSEVEFSKIRESEDPNVINEKFEEWMHSKWRNGLLSRLEVFKSANDFTSIEDCLRLANALFFIGKYSQKEDANFIKILTFFLNVGLIRQDLREKTSRQLVKDCVLENLKKAKSPYKFEIALLLRLRNKEIFENPILGVEEIDKILLRFLNDELENLSEGYFDSSLLEIYQCFHKISDESMESRKQWQIAKRKLNDFIKTIDPVGLFVRILQDSGQREVSLKRGGVYNFIVDKEMKRLDWAITYKHFFTNLKNKKYLNESSEIHQFLNKNEEIFQFKFLYLYQIQQNIFKLEKYKSSLLNCKNRLNLDLKQSSFILNTTLLGILKQIYNPLVNEILIDEKKIDLQRQLENERGTLRLYFKNIDSYDKLENNHKEKIQKIVNRSEEIVKEILEELKKEKKMVENSVSPKK